MSLVGSLEDLGLGDILQIVSLARKSGLLLLRSQYGDGRIVFESGLVRAAYVKHAPETLAGLLSSAGFGEAESVDRLLAQCGENASSQSERDARVADALDLTLEQVQSLCREHVERACFDMLRWRAGEFSFDVCDELDQHFGELSVPVGINAQYLMMEATRLGDEAEREPDAAASPGEPGESEPELQLSGDDSSETPGAVDTVAAAAVRGVEAEAPRKTTPEADPAAGAAPAASPAAPSGPLVVIDGELRALEWLKEQVSELFTRVHIFQHSEGGVARIRQYLGRGVLPVVLVSSHVPADSLTGAREAGELVRRLRAQAPRMPILAMFDGEGEERPGELDAADASLVRPSARLLGDSRRRAEAERMADELRTALAPWSVASGPEVPTGVSATDASRLARARAALHDPASRGEVLQQVLDFAASCFHRVALFMVRDDEILGIAQRRLPDAGGPDDTAIRGVRMGLRDAAWFRNAADGPGSCVAAPSDDGDRRLAALLGERAPVQAYVGTVRTGGDLAALVYGDDLPREGPLQGSLAELDALLSEAGQALERALRERVGGQAPADA